MAGNLDCAAGGIASAPQDFDQMAIGVCPDLKIQQGFWAGEATAHPFSDGRSEFVDASEVGLSQMSESQTELVQTLAETYARLEFPKRR